MQPAILDTRSARLAVALAARGMTYRDLGHLLKVRPDVLTRWTQRPTDARPGPPTRVTTEAIAAALGVPAAALEVGGPWGALVGEGRYLVEPVEDGRTPDQVADDTMAILRVP